MSLNNLQLRILNTLALGSDVDSARISPGGVNAELRHLAQLGLVRGGSRGWELTDAGREEISLRG